MLRLGQPIELCRRNERTFAESPNLLDGAQALFAAASPEVGVDCISNEIPD
jgi:hypothetical protein